MTPIRALLVLAVWAVAAITPASAGWPGRNGVIAFSSDRDALSLGEVFTVPVAVGGARNLTDDWSEQRGAVISPSGRSIAYVTRDGVVVMRSDGSSGRRVVRADVDGWHVVWSPDSRLLAYTARPRHAAEPELWVVPARGGVSRSLGSCGSTKFGVVARCFSWSPDSRRLAIVRDGWLAVATVAGGAIRVLADRAARYPSWSPDGRRIAFVDGSARERGAVKVLSLANGSVTTLAPVGLEAIWSPSSRRVAIVDEDGIVVVGADGSGRRRLARPYGGDATLPRWLPDSASVVYVSDEISEPPELWRAAADGKRPHRIATLAVAVVESLSLTPDGRSAIVGVDDAYRGNLGHIYTMRADGANVRRLPLGEGAGHPEWSPDGLRLAYRCGSDLCVAAPSGSGRRVVARRIDYESRLSWSPDGARIVFSREGSGLFIVGSGGGTPRKIPGIAGKARNPAWSPDGRWIAYEWVVGLGYVRLVRPDGGDARDVSFGEFYSELPDWSPDGRFLVLGREHNAPCNSCPPYSLAIVTQDGQSPRELTEPDGYHSPVWAPDGREIVFMWGGTFWSIRPDGEGRRRLHAVRGAEWTDSAPSWQPLCTRSGTDGADSLGGTPGRDLICGLGGDDRLAGGAGEDRLFGHAGDDRINASGGGFDVVGCGPGRDTVQADESDLVGVDCERVKRG